MIGGFYIALLVTEPLGVLKTPEAVIEPEPLTLPLLDLRLTP